jgi:predicted phosphodiesterase
VRLALIADIHGNLPALDAVLAEISREGVDRIVCLGDISLGPQPVETLERVRSLGCPVVAQAHRHRSRRLLRAMREGGMPHAEWWARLWASESRV